MPASTWVAAGAMGLTRATLQGMGGHLRGSTASWGLQEHDGATTTSGGAQEREAQQPWRQSELGTVGELARQQVEQRG